MPVSWEGKPEVRELYRVRTWEIQQAAGTRPHAAGMLAVGLLPWLLAGLIVAGAVWCLVN